MYQVNQSFSNHSVIAKNLITQLTPFNISNKDIYDSNFQSPTYRIIYLKNNVSVVIFAYVKI